MVVRMSVIGCVDHLSVVEEATLSPVLLVAAQ
jgi:hypothetical protein